MCNKVSVVTVCVNAESEIEKTMKSVMEQDYGKMEYIVKDGGSIDKTNELISNYQSLFKKKHITIKHIISKDNGIYDAMNIAVGSCEGEWVIFMNAGDMFYNDKVLSDIFEHKNWENSDIIYGHTLLRVSSNRGYIVNHNASFLEEGMSLCHQSLFVRRELILEFPFDCRYKIKADYDQMLRLKENQSVFTGTNTIISERNKKGISDDQVALCYKEDNMLRIQHNLNWKNKSVFFGYLKQIGKKIIPGLIPFWNVQKREKNIIRYKTE